MLAKHPGLMLWSVYVNSFVNSSLIDLSAILFAQVSNNHITTIYICHEILCHEILFSELLLDIDFNQLKGRVFINRVLISTDSYLNATDCGNCQNSVKPWTRVRSTAGGTICTVSISVPERVFSK